MNDAAVITFVRILYPKLEHQISLAKNFNMLESLKELIVQEKDHDAWMSPEHKKLLQDEERIRREYKSREKSLEALCTAFVDAYNAFMRLRKGLNHRKGKGDLAVRELVMTGDCESITKSFLE